MAGDRHLLEYLHMFRTRDLVIYISVLVFFVSAIGYTVVNDLQFTSRAVATPVSFPESSQTASVTMAAATSTQSADEIDRAANIARIRDKIAQGAGKIAGAPITLTSVDAPTFDVTTNTRQGERAVSWCEVPRRIDDVRADWNAEDIVITEVEGARVVLQKRSATSSVPRIQLPVQQTPTAGASCLAHEIIGITLDGDLIHNNDVALYATTPADIQIGYALDGFPIYGVDSTAPLDRCGGYEHNTGYRYHVRADENFILGCFAGTPAQFVRE